MAFATDKFQNTTSVSHLSSHLCRVQVCWCTNKSYLWCCVPLCSIAPVKSHSRIFLGFTEFYEASRTLRCCARAVQFKRLESLQRVSRNIGGDSHRADWNCGGFSLSYMSFFICIAQRKFASAMGWASGATRLLYILIEQTQSLREQRPVFA